MLNIGIEGMMLFAPMPASLRLTIAARSRSGFVAGGIGGALVASLVVLLCIRFGLNQIVIGIAVTLGMEGLTALLHYFQFSKTYPRLDQAPVWALPFLSDIPVIGRALFSHSPIVYLTVLFMIALAWLFRATYVGLNLEAAGNKPAALDAAGVSVVKTRAFAGSARPDSCPGSAGPTWRTSGPGCSCPS